MNPVSGFGTWNSMEFHGVPWKSMEVFLSWNFMEVFLPMEFHSFFPWNFFMEFYGVFPCTSMKIENNSLFSWNSVCIR